LRFEKFDNGKEQFLERGKRDNATSKISLSSPDKTTSRGPGVKLLAKEKKWESADSQV